MPDERKPKTMVIQLEFEVPTDFQPSALLAIAMNLQGKTYLQAPLEFPEVCLTLAAEAVATINVRISEELRIQRLRESRQDHPAILQGRA